jgi:hypothetical protein
MEPAGAAPGEDESKARGVEEQAMNFIGQLRTPLNLIDDHHGRSAPNHLLERLRVRLQGPIGLPLEEVDGQSFRKRLAEQGGLAREPGAQQKKPLSGDGVGRAPNSPEHPQRRYRCYS